MLYSEHISFKSNGIAFKDKNGKELSSGSALKKILNRFYSYIIDIEIYIVDLVGWVPFHWFRKLIYLLAGMKMARGSHIHVGARFFYPGNISIGKGTIVGESVFLDGRDKLKIGNFVDIASEVMVYNSEHDINSEDFHATVAPVNIGDYCFIGPRAIILPGVTLGKGAVVGAGAVVTKDVSEMEIVGGVPAQKIGERKSTLNYKLGRSRLLQ